MKPVTAYVIAQETVVFTDKTYRKPEHAREVVAASSVGSWERAEELGFHIIKVRISPVGKIRTNWPTLGGSALTRAEAKS